MNIQSQYFGRTDYLESLKLQQTYLDKVRNDPQQSYVLGFEFEDVITLGVRGNPEADLIYPKNIPVVNVARGGQATLHSPGQIVIYPICNIIIHEHRVKSWVCKLLKVSAKAIKNQTQVQAVEVAENGLYVHGAKVASIGLKVVRGVSTFGVAINLRNDPQLFKNIRPCGVANQAVAHLAYAGELETFFQEWLLHFKDPRIR